MERRRQNHFTGRKHARCADWISENTKKATVLDCVIEARTTACEQIQF